MKVFLSFGQLKRFVLDIGVHFPTFYRNRKYRKEYVEEFPFAVHFWGIGRRPFYTYRIEEIFRKKNMKIVDKFHSINPYHYFYLLEKP